MDLTVSVVIPAYNVERFLHDALDSVAWQTCPPSEVIVVDDGSPDCSGRIAAEYPGVTVIRQENGGLAAARNTGIAAAAGTVIALLDADDIWLPGRLERQLSLLDADPGLDGAFTHNVPFLDGPDVREPPWMVPGVMEKQAIFPLPSTWLIRRAAFERAGPFDPTYRVGEDLEWLARARRSGLRFETVPEGLVLRRIHGRNLSYREAELAQARSRVLRANILHRRGAAGSGTS